MSNDSAPPRDTTTLAVKLMSPRPRQTFVYNANDGGEHAHVDAWPFREHMRATLKTQSDKNEVVEVAKNEESSGGICEQERLLPTTKEKEQQESADLEVSAPLRGTTPTVVKLSLPRQTSLFDANINNGDGDRSYVDTWQFRPHNSSKRKSSRHSPSRRRPRRKISFK